jgi:hypothetical protein
MQRIIANFSLALTLGAPALLFAQTPAPPNRGGTGPCRQIVQACESAGFVRGDAREGYGLYRDCVNVIVHGTPRPANADKPLPSVPPQLVAACRKDNPHFDQGREAPAN